MGGGSGGSGGSKRLFIEVRRTACLALAKGLTHLLHSPIFCGGGCRIGKSGLMEIKEGSELGKRSRRTGQWRLIPPSQERKRCYEPLLVPR